MEENIRLPSFCEEFYKKKKKKPEMWANLFYFKFRLERIVRVTKKKEYNSSHIHHNKCEFDSP